MFLFILKKKLNNISCVTAALSRMWYEEFSFRVQVFSIVPPLLLALYFRVSALEWTLILFACLTLIVVEFINTAFEKVGDAVTQDKNTLIGESKELASAATFVAGLGVTVVFASILIPKLVLFILITS